MVVTADDTAYLSDNEQLHLSRACAGFGAMPIGLREAAGEHDPCRNCCTDSALTIIRNIAEGN